MIPRDLGEMPDDELVALDAVLAKDPREVDPEDRRDPVEIAGPSTLLMLNKLTSQMLGYHRELLRAWTKTTRRLEKIGRERPAGIATEVGAAIAAGVQLFEFAADSRYPKAWQAGQQLAVKLNDGVQFLSVNDSEGLVDQARSRNSEYVRDSLFADLTSKVSSIFVEGDEALDVKIEQTTDAMESRVGMYALALWGIAHTAFGKEMERAERDIWWVLTSGDPCTDCPRIASGSPYRWPDKPLPTYPGAGGTACKSNCLCVLRTA